MGSVGDCYDNAVCETFHASLKKEKIYRQSWPTRAAARTAIFEYIEGWYNPRRRHSTLAYLSPIEFERHHAEARPAGPRSIDFGNGSVTAICRHSTLAYLSPIEFERHHAELAQPALGASISDNGSVASISPRASDALTTRRISTVGVDFAADRSISPENALVLPTDPAQAATDGDQGTAGNSWPLRPVVKEQAR